MLTDLTVAYLFLGGTGAGALVVTGLLSLLAPRSLVSSFGSSASGRGPSLQLAAPASYRRFVGGGFAASFAALALGAFALFIDLGRPELVLMLFTDPHLTFLSFGSYVLAAGLACSLALACAWGLPASRLPFGLSRAIGLAGVLLGLLIALYTGLLLSSMPAVPFWSSPWLPLLFVASSLSCGLALVMGQACLLGSHLAFDRMVRRVAVLDAFAICVELIAAGLLVASAFGNGFEAAGDGARLLLGGELGLVFLVGFVVCGAAAPLSIEAYGALTRQLEVKRLFIACMLVLVGGFALRYAVVFAGMHPFLGGI